MAQARQLAAIMFTDIVGYTALMGKDEQKAFQVLRNNRHLQKPIIEKYSGKWMKELGDGVLASFPTVTDAVTCACEIQFACEKIPDLKLRIGIHQGEVVFENNDVFGDGVNIASRLQAMAPIGRTWISEAVYKNVTNKKAFFTEFIGEQMLKNVSEPVKVYEIRMVQGENSSSASLQKPSSIPMINRRKIMAIVALLFVVAAVVIYYLAKKRTDTFTQDTSTLEKSVAVLPFENLSGDPQQDYFSDGVSIEILNALSQLEDLKVPGRSSSFYFKGKKFDLEEIQRKLKVSAVLEGSVRRQGNRVRVDVQLVNTANGYNLWSQQYDRLLDDVFAIQEDIATAVVKKLKVTLLTDEKLDIGQGLTKNKEAYDLYLKARSLWDQRRLKESEKYFLEAISLDSSFAAAYAGLAETYIIFPQFSEGSPRGFVPKAELAAQKAIELDSSMAGPYFTLAFRYFGYGIDSQKAVHYFHEGFRFNDKYAPGHYWYGSYLSLSGDTTNAVKEVKRSIELDPLGPVPHFNLGLVFMRMHKLEAAAAAYKTSIGLNDQIGIPFFWLGYCYLELGKFDEARKAFEQASRLGTEGGTGGLIYLLFENGQREKAEALFNDLMTLAKKKYLHHFTLAATAAVLGKKDLANELLREAIEMGDFPMRIEKSKLTKDLLSDPRNIELMKSGKMNYVQVK